MLSCVCRAAHSQCASQNRPPVSTSLMRNGLLLLVLLSGFFFSWLSLNLLPSVSVSRHRSVNNNYSYFFGWIMTSYNIRSSVSFYNVIFLALFSLSLSVL